jgi:hypothetical protein
MYQFAVVALLALATVKVVDFVSDNVPFVEQFRSALTFIVAVGVTVWLDFSLFDGWDIAVRNEDLGIWITGFLVVGLTVPWRAVFGWLTHDRATGDESLGDHRGVIQKAA